MRASLVLCFVALVALAPGAAQALTLTYDVRLHDDHISAPPKIFATEGATIVFNVHNAANSTRAHSFVVGDPPLVRTGALAPDSDVQTIQHTFASVGSHPYYSDVANDRANGMEGLIIIQAAATNGGDAQKAGSAPGALLAIALVALAATLRRRPA